MSHDERKAGLHRIHQVEKLFQAANGREPTDAEELASWAASPKGRVMIDESGQIDSSHPSASHVRLIARYDFEDSGFVQIISSPDVDTEDALEMIETMIRLKRAEIARRKERTT